MPHFGKLIVFEGTNSAGKTTLSKWFVRALRNKNMRPVLWAAFPGAIKGTLGHLVYQLHHNKAISPRDLCPLSLQLLHVAAHIAAIESRLAQAIKNGTTVVLDRFWWSTWVYGRFTGCDPSALDSIIDIEKRAWGAIKPTKVFLLTRRVPESFEANAQLEALYSQLARRQANSVAIQRVQNDGSLEAAKKQILSSHL